MVTPARWKLPPMLSVASKQNKTPWSSHRPNWDQVPVPESISWALRSKNLAVVIAISWKGLGEDQFLEEARSSGGDRVVDDTAAVLGPHFPEMLPVCSPGLPMRWLCWFSISVIWCRWKQPERGSTYSGFSEGSAHGLVRPHACAAHHGGRDISQRRVLTWCLTGSWGRAHLLLFLFYFVWALSPCPQSCL